MFVPQKAAFRQPRDEKSGLVAVRVSRSYRAVGVRGTSGEIVWFWIGSHQEYEKLLTKLL